MSDNPFQAPESDLTVKGVISGQRADLRSVAVYQRVIMFCILIYFGCIVGAMVSPTTIRPMFGIAVLLDGLVGMIFVFLLCIKVYGTVLGIVLGLGTLVPCLNLLVLLVVNSKATNVLKSNGIKVGLLGANPADVEKVVSQGP